MAEIDFCSSHCLFDIRNFHENALRDNLGWKSLNELFRSVRGISLTSFYARITGFTKSLTMSEFERLNFFFYRIVRHYPEQIFLPWTQINCWTKQTSKEQNWLLNENWSNCGWYFFGGGVGLHFFHSFTEEYFRTSNKSNPRISVWQTQKQDWTSMSSASNEN